MTALRTAVLLAATVATGLSAGLFYAFAYAVMPGLARADDRTFVVAMQRVNVAILNVWFFAVFIGALILAALAALLHLRAGQHGAARWALAAAVLYVAVLVVTGVVNVPLNNELLASGDADPAAARARFEATWVRWNMVRSVLSTASFGCLAWALLLHGRPGAP
jgi:uncharacterized membrane protein